MSSIFHNFPLAAKALSRIYLIPLLTIVTFSLSRLSPARSLLYPLFTPRSSFPLSFADLLTNSRVCYGSAVASSQRVCRPRKIVVPQQEEEEKKVEEGMIDISTV